MPATALDLLELARGRVVRGWTQGAEARSSDGEPIDPWRSAAVAWSLLGTIVAGYEELAQRHAEFGLEELAAALHLLAAFVDDDSLVNWNDAPGRTQGDVVEAIEQALAAEPGPRLFLYSPN